MDHKHDIDVLNEDDKAEDDQRVLWCDHYLMANPGPLMCVVSKVTAIVEHTEALGELRQRRRKPRDQSALEVSINIIVSNLAHVFLEYADAYPLVVSRATSARSMYDNGRIPARTFVSCLTNMLRSGLITQDIGKYQGKATRIKPTVTLIDMLRFHQVDFNCFRQCPTRPLLILKRSIKKTPRGKTKRELVPYTRNARTDAMVAQVERVNSFLSAADINYLDNQSSNLRVNATANNRTLVRYFTIRKGQGVRFDQGGRLFGRCFWLALKSTERHRIRINGEPVADLDFVNLGPRLAYAKLSLEPPHGDLYDLTGLLKGYDHHNKEHRKAIKQSLASCFNGGRGGKRGTQPKDGKPGTTGILDPLPRGITAKHVREALLAKHPAFKPLFENQGTSIGYEIMFTESRILLCALEKLMALGVVALPQHDGLMVAKSNQRIAQAALQAASAEIVGVVLPVDVKAVYGAPEATEGLLAA